MIDVAQHFDNACVDLFAKAIKDRLAEKRAQGRGGWHDPTRCSVEHLLELLMGQIGKGDVVNIAAYCMMIHQRGVQQSEIDAFFARVVAETIAEHDAKKEVGSA